MRALDTARLLYVAVLCLSPTSHALRLPHSSRLASSSTALLSSDPPTLFALTTDGFLVAVDVDTGDLREYPVHPVRQLERDDSLTTPFAD